MVARVQMPGTSFVYIVIWDKPSTRQSIEQADLTAGAKFLQCPHLNPRTKIATLWSAAFWWLISAQSVFPSTRDRTSQSSTRMCIQCFPMMFLHESQAWCNLTEEIIHETHDYLDEGNARIVIEYDNDKVSTTLWLPLVNWTRCKMCLTLRELCSLQVPPRWIWCPDANFTHVSLNTTLEWEMWSYEITMGHRTQPRQMHGSAWTLWSWIHRG